jgi:hypothetical protein
MPRLSSATEVQHPSNSALYTNDVNSSACSSHWLAAGYFDTRYLAFVRARADERPIAPRGDQLLTSSKWSSSTCGNCDRIIAPRQPQMVHAIGFRSRELSPKNLVFGTVLRAVFSASAMGFCAICSMRLSHELKGFSSQLQLGFSPAA